MLFNRFMKQFTPMVIFIEIESGKMACYAGQLAIYGLWETPLLSTYLLNRYNVPQKNDANLQLILLIPTTALTFHPAYLRYAEFQRTSFATADDLSSRR